MVPVYQYLALVPPQTSKTTMTTMTISLQTQAGGKDCQTMTPKTTRETRQLRVIGCASNLWLQGLPAFQRAIGSGKRTRQAGKKQGALSFHLD
jgi:hypothetical protein